jgi:predicted DNA-binding transcriptional regulator YafY
VYATIRRYAAKGNVTTATLEQFRRQLHDEFIPQVQGISGFHGYYVVNLENRELLSISLFETETGAAESTRKSAEWVRKARLPIEFGKPEILQGEVLTSVEASREVGAR